MNNIFADKVIISNNIFTGLQDKPIKGYVAIKDNLIMQVKENENYFKEILQQYGADEAIVLTSTFDVDGSGGDGSLNPNSTYKDWIWLLVRNKQGEWKHVDHGY